MPSKHIKSAQKDCKINPSEKQRPAYKQAISKLLHNQIIKDNQSSPLQFLAKFESKFL